jgi:hypothetical protein
MLTLSAVFEKKMMSHNIKFWEEGIALMATFSLLKINLLTRIRHLNQLALRDLFIYFSLEYKVLG